MIIPVINAVIAIVRSLVDCPAHSWSWYLAHHYQLIWMHKPGTDHNQLIWVPKLSYA
jgi:hypothetical protein